MSKQFEVRDFFKLGYDNFENECQKDLPRDEYCVMIAVPEKTIMEDNE